MIDNVIFLVYMMRCSKFCINLRMIRGETKIRKALMKNDFERCNNANKYSIFILIAISKDINVI